MKKLLLAIIIAASLPAYAGGSYAAQMSRLTDEKAVTMQAFCKMGMAQCDPAPKATATERYKALLKDLKTKDQKAALKAYLVALLSEFDAQNVNSGETTRAYDARQKEAEKRTKEAWLNFELEL